jgi:hypothetical protein
MWMAERLARLRGGQSGSPVSVEHLRDVLRDGEA